MNSGIAINVENISKKFTIGRSSNRLFSKGFTGFFNLKGRKNKIKSDDFWALRQISFQVKRGEILGIVGPNGAGKSTLLKILAKIIRPTTGRIEMRGTTTGILDIGTGFHPELSGWENIFLNGQLLGLTKKDIKGKLAQIHEFSGIKEFINEPVKNYSDGMFLRLAFSVFAFMNPEILLLDEIFNVGDQEFQNKTKQKLKEIIQNGSTVVFVSHSVEEVMQLCNSCILLKEGQIEMIGDKNVVMEYYIQNVWNSSSSQYQFPFLFEQFEGKNRNDVIKKKHTIRWPNPNTAPQNEIVRISAISVFAANKAIGAPISMDDDIYIEVKNEKITENDTLQWVINIFDINGSRLLTDCYAFRPEYKPERTSRGSYTNKVKIPANLFNRGLYSIGVSVAKNYDFKQDVLHLDNILSFKINLAEWDKKSPWSNLLNSSLRPMLEWTCKKNIDI